MELSVHSRSRILCVGLACLDLVTVANEFPIEDSDTRSILHHRWQRGGNASNSCTILSHLGACCELMCTIGTDSQHVNPEFVVKDLQTHGINFDNAVLYEEHSGPFSVIIVNESNGSRTILHRRGNIPELNLHDFRSLDLSCYKWIHFEGRHYKEYVKMMAEVEKWNSEQESDLQIRVSAEIEKYQPGFESVIPLADFVFVSKDIAQVCGHHTKEDTAVFYSKYLKKGASVICTWGENGVAALTNDDDHRVVTTAAHSPAKVVDTLAAGDTFIGSVVYALSENHSLSKAVEFGCAIAGAKCGVHGLNIKKLAIDICDHILRKGK